MEDYSPTPAEVEETPVKRRRFLRGGFFESWRKLLEEDDNDADSESKGKSKKSKADKSKTETSKEDNAWLPERWRERFKGFFKSLVSLELVPAEAMVEDKPAKDIEDDEIITESVQEHLAMPENDSAIPVPDEEGLLAVSRDAQIRYGYELVEEPESDDETKIEIDDIEADQPIEPMQLPPDELALVGAQSQEMENDSGTEAKPKSENYDDAELKRRTNKLEKKVKKLRRRTRSLKHEQEDFNKKQKDFAKELDDRQKAQERFEKYTVPKMEQDRRELRKRLEESTEVKQEMPERKSVVPDSQQKPRVKSEYEPRPVKIEHVPKPETVLKPANLSAEAEKLNKILAVPVETNPLKETVFERRHEVKDNRSDDNFGFGEIPTPQPNFSPTPNIPPPFVPPFPTGNIPPIPNSQTPPTPKPPKPANNLYKQAAVTGTVSGVGLTIIIFLILLLMRY